MRTRYLIGMLAAAMLLTMLPGTASATGGEDRSYALALGDSLSVGYQPNRNGATAAGYATQLANTVRERLLPRLALRNLGCPGETARSMITGENSPCSYGAGSQLDAATAFLSAHRGEVAYVTFDIGTNDLFERCLDVSSFTFDPDCVRRSLPRVEARIARIVTSLRAAVSTGVPIVSMTYYDPLLGLWGVDGGHRLARISLRSFEALNSGFARTYRANGVSTARVDRAFRITRFEDAGGVPANVAIACRWTWFCSRRFFGDPHANDAGYARIAKTFAAVLVGRLR